MRKFTVTTAIAIVSAGSLHAAKPAPLTMAQVDTLPLSQMCSKSGPLGLEFGTTSLPKSTGTHPHIIRKTLEGTLAPLGKATLTSTKYSGKLASADYTLQFANESEAKKIMRALGGRLESAGWLKWADQFADLGSKADLDAAANPEDSAWFHISLEQSEDPEPPAEDVRFALDRANDQIFITCESTLLSEQNMQEALGQMPVGTAKPAWVDAQWPLLFDDSDCNDPAKRAGLLEMLDGDDTATLLPGAARLKYEENLSDWKIMKLTSSGKTSREALTDKIIGLIDTPDSMSSINDGMELLMDFFGTIEKLQPDDEAGLCHALHDTGQKGQNLIKPPPAGMTDIPYTKQWRATHALLDAEAMRLGVSFN
jgi:hypothetical protein